MDEGFCGAGVQHMIWCWETGMRRGSTVTKRNHREMMKKGHFSQFPFNADLVRTNRGTMDIRIHEAMYIHKL
jgi:hypothetical protein